MKGVTYMKTIDGIPIYADPYMDRHSFMVMYEKLWSPPGMIYIPFSNLTEIEDSPIDREILEKKKKDKKLSDVKGIICNSPEEDMDKIIQTLYKEFN